MTPPLAAATARLAVTLGDPRGIGPEVAASAARVLASEPDPPALTLIGPSGTAADPAGTAFVDVGAWDGGSDPVAAGRLAGLAIEHAVALALDGAVDGIVTAPIDKAALNAAGHRYPGHTELLASLADASAVAMLMSAERTALGGPLRVVLSTRHIPLREVAGALTPERILEQARVTAAGLRDGWGIDRPRMAVCALNPHASDGGLFGDEEARVLAPAVAALNDEGHHVTGPVPADTVFVRALRGEFDVVIAPYHDVGMAAFKTAAFGAGVNVTLGLPFVRTSPDHGTAMDMAGQGRAGAGSMLEALRLAALLVRRGLAPVSAKK